jgi:hypothetical protein
MFFDIQSLISQGKLVSISDVDMQRSYIQLSVYQPNSREKGSGNNAYIPYAIPLSEIFITPGNLPLLNGLFSQTADSVPVTNTITPGSLLGPGVGTLTVPANGFKVGDSFHLKMGGLLSSKNNTTLEVYLSTNGVLLASTGTMTLPNTTSEFWELEVDFVIRQVGPAGVAAIKSNGQFMYVKDASLEMKGDGFNTLNNTTFNTTISNTLEVYAKWGSANVLDSITSSITVLYKTF